MLGTFITEFGQGRLRCNRMFSTYKTARQVADQLVAIAAHYGFEGWLVSGSHAATVACAEKEDKRGRLHASAGRDMGLAGSR